MGFNSQSARTDVVCRCLVGGLNAVDPARPGLSPGCDGWPTRGDTALPSGTPIGEDKERRVLAVTETTARSEAAFDDAAQAHLDGLASSDQVAMLKADEPGWVAALFRLLDDADKALETARREMRGPGRANVLNDLDEECFRIDAAITELIGPPTEEELAPPPNERKPADKPREPGTTRLQLSWKGGHVVAWAGGPNAPLEGHDEVIKRLETADGGAVQWEPGDAVRVPGEGRAETAVAPLAGALGWLAAQARDHNDDSLGPSVRWMGLVAAMGVEHVAQGRYVLRVAPARSRQRSGSGSVPFRVRWIPALVDHDAVTALAACMPGTAMVGQSEQDPEAFTNAMLADVVHTIVASAASMVDAPAAPPDIRGRKDVGETVIANLDGAEFTSPRGPATDVGGKLKDWSAPVTGKQKLHLIVQLDAPDESDGWFAQVLAPTPDGRGVEPIEKAETAHSKTRGRLVRDQVRRLERLFPPLFRGGGRRRGEVILSQDEAWRLMSDDGQKLHQAGFEMRVPKLAPTSAVATLRLTALDAGEAAVGAQQLANVRWSVMFDDVELTAEDVARLAAEARPMVQSHGQWVEIDKVDLDAAAEALDQRADKTKMSGAEMLREALGLEDNPLGGSINLSGDSWAAALFRGIEALPEHPETEPDGFSGTLRSYQADALAWLEFLDDAGLGGCLALDMGLGKTPTTLAAFMAGTEHGPGLVIAPPAVVGNWASEAANFTPDLSVHVHHGPSRASGKALERLIADHDVVITTYGTAVRDMDQLCEIEWGKIAIDEAQAIKNPAAETSQQLRRLEARTRIALTGTPIENGLGDLWSIMDWANPGLVGPKTSFIAQLTPDTNGNGSGPGSKAKAAGEAAMKALNGVLVYRRTKSEPDIAAELPDRIDELDHCMMTEEQIGLYQAVIDKLVAETGDTEQGSPERKGAVLAAITALKQICNHPWNYEADELPLAGRSGKLTRLLEIIESVFAADEKMLIFTHFATWGERLAEHLTEITGQQIDCYHGGLARGARDRMVSRFQNDSGAGALVLSLKAGGTGLNLTAANHVVLYDRWWNPAVEDQARDRAWRIGQTKTVIAHRLVCPGTVDERVEEVVAGKRQIADLVLPKSSSVGDLDADQLQAALGIDPSALLTRDESETYA